MSFLNGGNIEHPAAELVNLKSKGKLMYPNTHLYNFLNLVKDSFAKQCNSFDVFSKVIDEIIDGKFDFKYSCSQHCVEVATEILVYYLQMRLRQFSSNQENLKFQKISREKKKVSKLFNTLCSLQKSILPMLSICKI